MGDDNTIITAQEYQRGSRCRRCSDTSATVLPLADANSIEDVLKRTPVEEIPAVVLDIVRGTTRPKHITKIKNAVMKACNDGDLPLSVGHDVCDRMPQVGRIAQGF